MPCLLCSSYILVASFEDFFDVSLDIALEMGQNTQVSVESLMNRFIQTERLVDKVRDFRVRSVFLPDSVLIIPRRRSSVSSVDPIRFVLDMSCLYWFAMRLNLYSSFDKGRVETSLCVQSPKDLCSSPQAVPSRLVPFCHRPRRNLGA